MGGDAGSIAVNVANSLQLIDGGQFSSATLGGGEGGNITVTANQVLIDAQNSGLSVALDRSALTEAVRRSETFTGLVAPSLFEGVGAGGSGKISVNASSLSILGGGLIAIQTGGPGAGGSIAIDAEQFLIDGQANEFTTGVFAETQLASAKGLGGPGGEVVVNSAQLELKNGGEISSSTFGAGSGGLISVGTRSLEMSGGAEITSLSIGTGDAGTIDVQAKKIVIDGQGEGLVFEAFFNPATAPEATEDFIFGSKITGILATSQFKGENAGNGGSIIIDADALEIRNGGLVSSSATGTGAGGSIVATVDKVFIDGQGVQPRTGLYAASLSANGGNGGAIELTSKSLDLYRGGQISTITIGLGTGGNIKVTTDDLFASRQEAPVSTGLFADTYSAVGGDAGEIAVNIAHSLQLIDGGQISSATLGRGKGGNITVTADQMLIDAQNSGFSLELSRAELIGLVIHKEKFTGLFAPSLFGKEGAGDSGKITVMANSLDILEGGIIATQTAGSGSGGTISVTSDTLLIDSKENKFFTGVFAETLLPTEEGLGGRGGEVLINSFDLLKVKNGGQISSSTFGRGSGGSVTVEAGSLAMSNGANISSLSEGTGDAGSISVSSMSDLTLADGSRLSVESRQSNAGNLRVSVGKSLSLDSSSITASAGLDGGNVEVVAKDFVWLTESSSIEAEAKGDGGNIALDAQFVLLDDSIISANAVKGRGGNIDVSANLLLQNGDSSITASSEYGVDGEVQINSTFDLGSAMLTLNDDLLDASSRLESSCAVKFEQLRDDWLQRRPLFKMSGRIGLPPQPACYQLSQRLVPLPAR